LVLLFLTFDEVSTYTLVLGWPLKPIDSIWIVSKTWCLESRSVVLCDPQAFCCFSHFQCLHISVYQIKDYPHSRHLDNKGQPTCLYGHISWLHIWWLALLIYPPWT
jgi:hypothetical protein